MTKATTRFYLLLAIDPRGGVLGVYGDASDPQSTLILWDQLNEETNLCHDFFDSGMLPEPTGPGMLCICGEFDGDRRRSGSAVDLGSPAPAWRRPTLDEMIAVIEGKTPPTIAAWLDAVKP